MVLCLFQCYGRTNQGQFADDGYYYDKDTGTRVNLGVKRSVMINSSIILATQRKVI